MQLHKRNTFKSVRTEDLFKYQKHESLALIMLMKEKRDGTIKGHGVADKGNQQEKIEPNDATSSTVSSEALKLSATINALEEREVDIVDIPGAFLSTDMDDKMHIVF